LVLYIKRDNAAFPQLGLIEKRLSLQKALGAKKEPDEPALNIETVGPRMRKYILKELKAEIAKLEALIQKDEADHPEASSPGSETTRSEAVEEQRPADDAKRDKTVAPPQVANKTNNEEIRHFTF
jgi:hypothetical protein